MFKILFFCTGKSARSKIAQAFAQVISTKDIEIYCAGDKKVNISDETIEVMKEKNIQISGKFEYSIDDLKNQEFDLVITLCNKAFEICPAFPGSPARLHWSLPDPLKHKNENDKLKSFRDVRDDLESRVYALFKFGFISTIKEMRTIFGSLLNHLTDGVIAHDLDRRIFFMNDAAEKITGYKKEEVIGRDCHEVFPGRFCGGDCSFCEERAFESSKLAYSRVFTKKNKDVTNLEMSVITIAPPNNRVLGVLVIFKDISEMVHLRKRLEESRGYLGIIGHHLSMQKVFNSIRELADVNVPILIQGDTGTGKEMVANALHQSGKNSAGPFVPINCAALPEGTLESELFGHVKGAFTGAISDRKGRFELAEGGTLFLDEIGEISHQMQVKLLRVLQENCFVPVGGEKLIKINVRVICATNKDLKELTKKGLFREDLYYRLAVVPINLPSLKERESDIPILIDHFLDKYSVNIGRKIKDISKDALALLRKYPWPGNVRELSNAVQYAMIKCSSSDQNIQIKHLPPEILEAKGLISKAKSGRPISIDIDLLKEALIKTAGNKARAAKLLGISRTSIYRIIKENKL